MSGAGLDVSDAIEDSNLNSTFDVLRRAETVGDDGFSTTKDECFRNASGVVCAASGNDLERLDDQQRMGRHLSIVTKFPLRGPSRDRQQQSYQPDIVQWQGDSFVIQALDPYPHFGDGFVQAICGSIDLADRPPPSKVTVL